MPVVVGISIGFGMISSQAAQEHAFGSGCVVLVLYWHVVGVYARFATAKGDRYKTGIVESPHDM
jgi:hypothetical protein